MIKKIKKYVLKRFFRGMEEYDITLEELLKKQQSGTKIIDVRSKQEYNEGHLNGAINIPEYEINANVNKVLKDKNEEIVVYCSSGVRSKKALKKLNQLGYMNVYNLFAGFEIC